MWVFLPTSWFSNICLNVKIPLHLHIKSMLQECAYVFPVALRTRKTFILFEKHGIGERSGSSIPWRRVHPRSSLGSAFPTMANLESFFLPSRHPYPKESTLLEAQAHSLSSHPQITCPVLDFKFLILSWFLEYMLSFFLSTMSLFSPLFLALLALLHALGLW